VADMWEKVTAGEKNSLPALPLLSSLVLISGVLLCSPCGLFPLVARVSCLSLRGLQFVQHRTHTVRGRPLVVVLIFSSLFCSTQFALALKSVGMWFSYQSKVSKFGCAVVLVELNRYLFDLEHVRGAAFNTRARNLVAVPEGSVSSLFSAVRCLFIPRSSSDLLWCCLQHLREASWLCRTWHRRLPGAH
jgi:hypothetical protein